MTANQSTVYSSSICSVSEDDLMGNVDWAVICGYVITAAIVISYTIRRHLLANKKNDGPLKRDVGLLTRKSDFLERAGPSYGYQGSRKGYIDEWRATEFPNLVKSFPSRNQIDRIVYLDYAGAALPARSQLIASLSESSVLANPHSTGPAASQTSRLIEKAKSRVRRHFNCQPGRFAGLQNVAQDCNPEDLHPGYEIIFTSGATEALRIVAERFPWTACQNCSSNLVYPQNSHTSVLGMREPAMAHGASFQCLSLDQICTTKDPNDWLDASQARPCGSNHPHLLVVSAECNFGGTRPDVASIVQRCSDKNWSTMIDYSKAASTGLVDLKKDDPDFACLSFYKLFGEPTGLGALFVKRSATALLMSDSHPKQYFGGGAVDVILPGINFTVLRQQPSPLASLSNGTVHFRGIVSLIHGFDELDSLGGMSAIKRHTTCLVKEFVQRLQQLRHWNGTPVVVVYGAWATTKNEEDEDRGPTVAFNCLRSDGTFVGYNEVSKLAELHEPPIQIRTGCFCNPGACQEALGLKDEIIKENYFTNGHVCGDHIDIVEGKPTGAIRVSFGKDNLWEDLEYLVSFLEKTFVDKHSTTPLASDASLRSPTSIKAHVTELYIFPIKSCAAQRVKTWSLDSKTARFALDREFALVDSSGSAMRLQRYPQMTQIKPHVDLQNMTMTVSAPGHTDLSLSLDDNSFAVKPNGVIKVCGNKCGGQLWGSYESSQWFSNVLGVQCWLARHTESPKAFANEESILLISQNAVDRLNMVLKMQHQRQVQTKHFRPNIVVHVKTKGEATLSESTWTEVEGEDCTSFESAGECARCSMVDIDPTTGMKGKTLRALADHNRSHGRITFGIFLRRKATSTNSLNKCSTISQGDILQCK